jgi:hypothetical protein
MVSTASLFPRFVSAVEAADLYKPVTLAEIKQILVNFKSERSPGPDGWSTEFFCYFLTLWGWIFSRWWKIPVSLARLWVVLILHL